MRNRLNSDSSSLKLLIAILDICLLSVSLLITLKVITIPQQSGLGDNWVALFFFYVLSFVLTQAFRRFSSFERQISAVHIALRTLTRCALTILLFATFVTLSFKVVPRHLFLTLFILSVIILEFVHILIF